MPYSPLWARRTRRLEAVGDCMRMTAPKRPRPLLSAAGNAATTPVPAAEAEAHIEYRLRNRPQSPLAEWIEVSPDAAALLLTANTKNRKYSPANTKRYTADMRRGAWRV